jgi:transcriptional regulator with XRE-family HTH domain
MVRDVSTLESRILWLVEHRAEGSQRELSRRAGLSPNYIGTILTRLRKNANAQIEKDSLVALAKAGDVSLDWLMNGRGNPERETVLDTGSPLRLIEGWRRSVDDAREKGSFLPDWVWERAGEIRNAHAPVPLTPEFVLRTALYVYDTVALEEKAHLALASVRDEIASHNAAVADKEERDPQQKLERRK